MEKEILKEELDIYTGGIFALKYKKRAENDNHVMAHLYFEDDNYSFKEIEKFSYVWIEDLIDVLQEAKEKLQTDERFHKNDKGWYEFKEVGED